MDEVAGPSAAVSFSRRRIVGEPQIVRDVQFRVAVAFVIDNRGRVDRNPEIAASNSSVCARSRFRVDYVSSPADRVPVPTRVTCHHGNPGPGIVRRFAALSGNPSDRVISVRNVNGYG